jgi:hypothetical protein
MGFFCLSQDIKALFGIKNHGRFERQSHYSKAPADVYQPGQKTARIPPSMKKHQPVSLMLIGVVF